MRLSLWNQPEIAALSQPLLQALKHLMAATQQGWNTEHNPDGTHTDVTADSVTGLAMRSRGRFISSRICDVNNPATATTSPLMPGTGRFNTAITGNTFFDVLRVRTNTAGVDPTIIGGIDATGREEGDRIIIVNSGNGNLTLQLSSISTSPSGTQFVMDANLTPLVFGELTIGTGGWVEAIYLRHIFFNKLYWHLQAVREV